MGKQVSTDHPRLPYSIGKISPCYVKGKLRPLGVSPWASRAASPARRDPAPAGGCPAAGRLAGRLQKPQLAKLQRGEGALAPPALPVPVALKFAQATGSAMLCSW
jgi:hypothetical protein